MSTLRLDREGPGKGAVNPEARLGVPGKGLSTLRLGREVPGGELVDQEGRVPVDPELAWAEETEEQRTSRDIITSRGTLGSHPIKQSHDFLRVTKWTSGSLKLFTNKQN